MLGETRNGDYAVGPYTRRDADVLAAEHRPDATVHITLMKLDSGEIAFKRKGRPLRCGMSNPIRAFRNFLKLSFHDLVCRKS